MFNFNYSSPLNFNNDLIYYNNIVNQINSLNYFLYNEYLKAQYLRQNGYNIIPEQNVNYNYLLMPQNFQIPNVNLNYYINNLIQKQKIEESKFSNIPPINCVSSPNINTNKNNILCSDSNQNIEGNIFYIIYIFRKVSR
jgi:hypothetical protein